ncbi:MAG: ATP-NAD kinase family protein [Thermoplasmata archaeon]
MKRLGLIVNPVAGMGGPIGLKGTDGPDVLESAMKMGAKQSSPEKALRALNRLREIAGEMEIVTCSSDMGQKISAEAGLNYKVLCTVPDVTSRSDTIRCAKNMREAGVDLLLFVGGDGTARDICEAVGESVTVLGVPAGVKMYSSCFAITPEAAGDLARLYLKSRVSETHLAEVLDVDEEMFRKGTLSTRLYCYLRVPYERSYLQGSKVPTRGEGEVAQQEAIAEQVVDSLQEGHCYIVGPGTTAKSIVRMLGIESNVLGIDMICKDGGKVKCVGKDMNEQAILDAISKLGRERIHLIITPLGGQGFILGRGNQQLSPRVMENIRRENIMIVATPEKIRTLSSKHLLIDTGSLQLDRSLEGYYRVITGYRMFFLLRAKSRPYDS